MDPKPRDWSLVPEAGVMSRVASKRGTTTTTTTNGTITTTGTTTTSTARG